MKNFWNILVAVALLSFVGCSEVEIVEKQGASIVSFLTSKHTPKLIDESDLDESLEVDPPFYTSYDRTTYRYIQDFYNTDRDDKTIVESGAKLTITFWCYDFSAYATPADSYLYYTNDPAYKEAFMDSGLNSEYWDFTPRELTLGRGQILKAVETALVGCRQDDMVEIYLTYNVAYGDNFVGVTALESPIAFFCKIISVEN